MWRTISETAQAPTTVPSTNTIPAPIATRLPQRRIPPVFSPVTSGAHRYRLSRLLSRPQRLAERLGKHRGRGGSGTPGPGDVGGTDRRGHASSRRSSTGPTEGDAVLVRQRAGTSPIL